MNDFTRLNAPLAQRFTVKTQESAQALLQTGNLPPPWWWCLQLYTWVAFIELS